MIKVLITDDHPVVRRGIRQILEDDDRIEKVEEAGKGKELLEKLREEKFDVILLDISLPGGNGLDLIGRHLAPSRHLVVHRQVDAAVDAVIVAPFSQLNVQTTKQRPTFLP